MPMDLFVFRAANILRLSPHCGVRRAWLPLAEDLSRLSLPSTYFYKRPEMEGTSVFSGFCRSQNLNVAPLALRSLFDFVSFIAKYL